MATVQVTYYASPSGREPVREFIDSLKPVGGARVLRSLLLLGEFRVASRGSAFRLFFAPVGGELAVLHGWREKRAAWPRKMPILLWHYALKSQSA